LKPGRVNPQPPISSSAQPSHTSAAVKNDQYEKCGLAASVTATGGVLFLACCSHNVAEAEFAEAVRRGLGDAGRGARILRIAGADADHPIHPALPETAYLKAVTLALD